MVIFSVINKVCKTTVTIKMPAEKLPSGNESEAVVEFAPFSKYPSEKKVKVDQRAGTIQEGKFLVSLSFSSS